MATVLQIGKVRPTYRGEWDSTAGYEVLDWVQYRGLAYQALQDVPVNREPDVSPEYWAQTGMKGDKGEQGVPGPAGPAGVNGRDGLDGAQGPQGVGPKHSWKGTALAFENPDGIWAAAVDLKGPQGMVGPEGPQGSQGIPGPQGVQGPQGPQGAVGPRGATSPLINTVTSTSTTEAATANAVKIAYDKGVEGLNAAWAAAGQGFIAGGIVPFSGGFGGSDGKRPIPRGKSVANEGWVLCDGSNGTPNLKDRFIVGAGASYGAWAAGGSVTHAHAVSGNAGATTLSIYEMPSHRHGMTTCVSQNQVNGDYPVDSAGNYLSDRGVTTHYTGYSGAHTHSLSASAAAANGLPPYFALSYIMKL